MTRALMLAIFAATVSGTASDGTMVGSWAGRLPPRRTGQDRRPGRGKVADCWQATDGDPDSAVGQITNRRDAGGSRCRHPLK